jgi:hypothetical protein
LAVEQLLMLRICNHVQFIWFILNHMSMYIVSCRQ